MHEAEINKQLNSDYDKFIYGKYEGAIPIPSDILELFEIGIRAMPSYAHKLTWLKIKSIVNTPLHLLTNTDLNDVIKVVLNISPERLYPDLDFEQIIQKGIRMDRFVLSYNSRIEEFKKKLEERKKSLTDLTSGVRGNGMKIISNE